MPKLSKSTAVRDASWLLRVGLAAVLLYAIVSSTLNPDAWIGFIPPFATHFIAASLALKLFSFFQLLLVMWLLSGKALFYASLITALTMVGIIVANFEAFDTTFRDIAILFAALALARLSKS
jgi:hypothetical protein